MYSPIVSVAFLFKKTEKSDLGSIGNPGSGMV